MTAHVSPCRCKTNCGASGCGERAERWPALPRRPSGEPFEPPPAPPGWHGGAKSACGRHRGAGSASFHNAEVVATTTARTSNVVQMAWERYSALLTNFTWAQDGFARLREQVRSPIESGAHRVGRPGPPRGPDKSVHG